MSPGDLFSMATRALGAHGVRTKLTVAAVAVGVAAVLLLTSLGQSAKNYVVNQFSGIGSIILIVIPGKVETSGGPPMAPGTTRDLTLDDVKAMWQLPAVRDIAPVSVGLTMAKYEGRSRSVTIIGSTPNFVRLRDLRVMVGQNLPEIDPKSTAQVCLVGTGIQRELFKDQSALGKILRLGDNRFRVIGLLAPEGESMGVNIDELILVPVANAMKMVNREGLFRIMVEVGSVDELKAGKSSIIRLLTDRHEKEDFTVITQKAVVESLADILNLLTVALTAIAAISLAVAGIGIMNVMLVSVTERTAEIGLMKSIGASNRQVMVMFLAEAATLALFGGLLGVIVGVVGAQSVELMLPAFPMSTPLWAIEASLGVALFMGVIFGTLPAVKAARMMPLEALRAKM